MYDALNITAPHSQKDLLSLVESKQIRHTQKTLDSGLLEYVLNIVNFRLDNVHFHEQKSLLLGILRTYQLHFQLSQGNKKRIVDSLSLHRYNCLVDTT